jgi:hypothetical protein
MSLINDALKRAKQAPAPPPPTGPHLRAAEPAQYARHSLGLLVPVSLAIVALLGLFFAWRLHQRQEVVKPVEVRAQTATVGVNHSAAPDTAVAPAPQPTPVPPPPVSPPPAPTETASAPAATNSPASASSNTVSTLEPPKPAPLKLQVIVYRPGHASAMISGKTVFVGDRVGECRVVAIDKDSATLVGAGQTNVLSLDQ